MVKKFLCAAALAMTVSVGAWGADYGLPANIQDGNILHCFNWTIAQVKADLPNIAKAGYGSVQLSPLQRADVKVGSAWHDLYRPYDLSFKGGLGTEAELKALCDEAATYGIKVVVDVVANHVDKTAGYHDTWWDSNNRVRWEGPCRYGDRYSITHGQLGDYGDVNSELSEVQAKGKAYVEKLKSLGVKGIRWDAAKHIATPSEGCGFWSTVTSVPGMYHYGEILNDDATPVNEYVKYMSITDNRYSDGAAKNNGGIQQGYGGAWAVDRGIDSNKLVYWAESHDTYSNDEWSQNVDQSVIDRAYACVATRNGATALYLVRPDVKGFNNIKIGKGNSTAYRSAAITAVNKLRNVAGSAKDWCTTTGNAFSCTRQGIGAVVVMKGSGNITIENGGGYCPAGSYVDQVSGGSFTVTASTISGNVGSSGIAVLIKDGAAPDPNPDPNPGPTPDPVTGSMYILGNLEGAAGWSTTPGTGAAMTKDGNVYTASNVKFVAAAGETTCYFNITDYVGSTWDDLNMNANRYGAATEGAPITLGAAAKVVKYTNNIDASACMSWTVPAGSYDVKFDASAMTVTVTNAGDNPNPNPNPTPDPTPDPVGTHYIYYDGTFSAPQVWAWNASGNCTTATAWPGDNMVKKNNMWYWEVPAGKSLPTQVIIHESGNKIGGGDLAYVDKATYHQDGSYSTGDNPNPNPNPDPTPDPTAVTISGDYNLAYSGNHTNVYYWGSSNPVTWDGAPAMETAQGSDGKTYKVYKLPAGMTNVIFKTGGSQTDDLDYTGEYIMNDNGATTTKVVFGSVPPVPAKPVVTISPNGGKVKGTATITVSVNDATSVSGSFNGKTLTLKNGSNSISVSQYLTADGQQGTLSVSATNDAGTTTASASFTRSDAVNPTPAPSGDNLITDYYKVNPDGQFGSNRTVNMSFSNANSSSALSNWTADDLIAQGVARDVAQAMKGVHERPIVDSYAIYAAYDNKNLYLGVQFVYTVWDLYGEGKQPGESKPYNMDGHMCWAFDLDPEASFDGYINGTGPIWNDQQEGAYFDNGVDAIWMGSTKPGVGVPGFFVPTPDGHASYDAPYCKASTVKYGYADGLLPSIDAIYGQKEFGFEPEVLEGNDGFVDLKGEIAESAHTFYEFTFPLELLGVTENYIKTNGIGVMYVDKYGSSPVGGTPYDSSYFDNVKGSYSMDPSSSQEKEDKDIITYAPARIGKASSGVDNVSTDLGVDGVAVIGGQGVIRILGADGKNAVVASIAGQVYFQGQVDGNVALNAAPGLYIVNVAGKGYKVVVR